MSMRLIPRGIALPTTMYFLVLLGLLVAGTLYTARSAGAAGEMSIEDAELTAAVERALTDAMTPWPARQRAVQAVGSTVYLPPVRTDRVERSVSITRVGARVFWIGADVRRVVGSARRRASLLVRLVDDGPTVPAAITARGNVLLGGGARVVATGGPSADCAIDDSTGVAIEVANDATVRADDAATTLPAWMATSHAADPSTYAPMGARERGALSPDLEIAPGAVLTPTPSPSGACGTAIVPDDWGDQLAVDGPCASWMPIVHARGDLTLAGGRGQGILLVDGRLRVTGALRFRGLIVSLGGVEISSDDVEISGAVLGDVMRDFGGAPGSSVVIRGRVTLRASRCDVARAFASHAVVRRVHERAWIELW